MLSARIIAITALSFTLLSCGSDEVKQTTQLVPVTTVTVEKKDLKLDDLYVAHIQAVRNVEIRGSVQGYLEAMFVDEGQKVKEGQLLFKLRDNELKNEVTRAKALLSVAKADKMNAEVEYDRVKGLVDKKIVVASELSLAESKLNAAESRIDEATSNLSIATHRLSYTQIRAPFDGYIDRIPLKKGSLVSEGTLISSISDISSVYAYFNISENEYLKYKRALMIDSGETNKTVSLLLSDGKEYDQKGVIETVVSEFEESTGSIAFRARFLNPHQLLRHNANGKIKLADRVEGALVIPQKATFEIQDKTYVFVVDRTNTVHMRHFVPGERTEQLYIVKSGLQEGDVIVFEGIQLLKDGIKVAPRKAQ
jgi:membrane fusion protein, multidrug efflux system